MRFVILAFVAAGLFAIEERAVAVEWGEKDVAAVQWSALVAASEKCRLSIPRDVVSRAKITMQKVWGIDGYRPVDETVVRATWNNMDAFRPMVLVAYCDFIAGRLTAASTSGKEPKGVMPTEWLDAQSRLGR